MVNCPSLVPGYDGLKMTETEQTVPAELVVAPVVSQPAIGPIANSEGTFGEVDTDIPLMLLAAVNSIAIL